MFNFFPHLNKKKGGIFRSLGLIPVRLLYSGRFHSSVCSSWALCCTVQALPYLQVVNVEQSICTCLLVWVATNFPLCTGLLGDSDTRAGRGRPVMLILWVFYGEASSWLGNMITAVPNDIWKKPFVCQCKNCEGNPVMPFPPSLLCLNWGSLSALWSSFCPHTC